MSGRPCRSSTFRVWGLPPAVKGRGGKRKLLSFRAAALPVAAAPLSFATILTRALSIARSTLRWNPPITSRTLAATPPRPTSRARKAMTRGSALARAPSTKSAACWICPRTIRSSEPVIAPISSAICCARSMKKRTKL